MKIVVFSDLHAHPFKPYATVLANGMNSRLAHAVSCVKQVLNIAKREKADLVLFGGDMFHQRRTIAVPAFNAIYEAFAQFAVARIPVVMIHGNHDQADRNGDAHSLYTFRTLATVCDSPGWVTVSGRSGAPYAILGLPYTENVEHVREVVRQPCPLPQAKPLLLAHLGVQGATLGSDFIYSNPHDVTLSDLNLDAFDAAFLGHYHKHQQLAERCWYVGAPLQHTWGDVGQSRGCVVYDVDDRTVTHVPLEAPQFVVLEEGEKAPVVGSYVRIEDDRAWPDEKREEVRARLDAASVEVVPPKSKPPVKAARLEINPSSSLSDALVSYVVSGVQPYDGLDDGYLLQMGSEILASVEGTDDAV